MPWLSKDNPAGSAAAASGCIRNPAPERRQSLSTVAAGSVPIVELKSAAANHTDGTATILLIEDDLSVAKVMREALELRGYRVLTASEPKQALEIASNLKESIQLPLSGMVLHTVHGVDLARQIQAIRKGIRVLFVSGYTGLAASGQPFLHPGVAFLQKPFARRYWRQRSLKC
jgi:CheY-like chemotaxis protein